MYINRQPSRFVPFRVSFRNAIKSVPGARNCSLFSKIQTTDELSFGNATRSVFFLPLRISESTMCFPRFTPSQFYIFSVGGIFKNAYFRANRLCCAPKITQFLLLAEQFHQAGRTVHSRFTIDRFSRLPRARFDILSPAPLQPSIARQL